MAPSVNPTPHQHSPHHQQAPEEPEGSGVNPLEILQFVWGAARRHPYTCLFVGVLVMTLGLAIVSALPRTYESTSKVYIASTGFITSQLTSGRRAFGDDDATKDVAESVFNQANLQALARDAQLVENWPKTRNWAQRLIDQARAAIVGPTSARDMEEVIIATLERMIEVRPEDSASIRFRAQWRDPATAQNLTVLLQRNYIASKQREELAAITRATTVLEDELKRADDAFEPAVRELKDQITKLREQAKDKAARAVKPAAAPVAAGPIIPLIPRPTTPPLELTAKLNEIRTEERSVLEPWQRRTAELKFQLADLRAVYGPAHPTVVALEAKLKSASAEPVELLDIRQREAELKALIAGATTPGGSLSAATGGLVRGPNEAPAADPLRNLIEDAATDPSLAPARIQLESVLRKSQEMQSRLDGARMELAIARVGFEYRYRQVEPAKFWPKPIKPKVPVLVAAAIVVGLLLGVLAGAGRELLSGKIMETWQAKQVGVEVIATVDLRGWQSEKPTRRTLPSSTRRS